MKGQKSSSVTESDNHMREKKYFSMSLTGQTEQEKIKEMYFLVE